MNKNNNKNKTFEHRRELIKLLATSPLLGSSLLQYATALDNPALLKSDLEKIIQSQLSKARKKRLTCSIFIVLPAKQFLLLIMVT